MYTGKPSEETSPRTEKEEPESCMQYGKPPRTPSIIKLREREKATCIQMPEANPYEGASVIRKKTKLHMV